MILDTVKNILAQQFEVSVDSMSEETNIVDDLGADSLDVVELVMSLEDEYGISIPDEDMPEMNTIGKIVEYIESKQ